MGGLGRDLLAAFALLTRLPLPAFPRGAEAAPGEPPLARCFWAFPLVGVVVGLIGAGLYRLALALALPVPLAAILAVAAGILATGAFHEDGLADSADGLGARTRERRLEIMRDSRIGSFGAIALILSLGLRVTALAEIATPGAVTAALIVAGALGRGSILGLVGLLAPARRDGMAASIGRPPAKAMTAGLLLALLVPLALLPPVSAAATLLAATFGGAVMAILAQRRIGGYTGDTLGALEQVVECAVLLVLVAAMPR